jgi:hypothetical protein
MENHRRDDSPSGLSDIVEGEGLLGTGLTVNSAFFFLLNGNTPRASLGIATADQFDSR